MTVTDLHSKFEAKLLRPADPVSGGLRAFVVLPREASETLPRRGRTTVEGRINGRPFQATLEPDGRRSHWLPIGDELLAASGAEVGEIVALEIAPA